MAMIRRLQWQLTPQGLTSTQRKNLTYTQLDALGVGIVNGIAAFLAVFLTRLGATDFEVGLLSSMSGFTGLFLAGGTNPTQVMSDIRDLLGERVSDMILPGELRAMILQVFDRTFLVTYLMEAVAVMIGLFGISTSFAALAAWCEARSGP